MSERKYLCYGCQKVCSYENLSYECMCFHPEEEIEYRGVCRECVKQKKSVEIPTGHNLEKIHTHKKKYRDIWNSINKHQASSFYFNKEGLLSFDFIEAPTGETGDDAYYALARDGLLENGDMNLAYNKYKKTITTHITHERFKKISKCVCCE